MKNSNRYEENVIRTENQLVSSNVAEISSNNGEGTPQVAVPGKTITLTLFEHETNESETNTYNLIDRNKTKEKDISLESPIGKNIHNLIVGQSATYTVNNFKFTVTILKIENTLALT
jgi:transcription elongation GreA/GreB family factor